MVGKIERVYQKGLTLVELLITLVVMSLIMGGLVAAFISHSWISSAEEARIDVQQNLRVATDRLKHALKHAGFGCYNSFDAGYEMTGEDPDGNTVTFNTFIADATSEYLTIVYGFKRLGDVDSIEINDNSILIETDDGKDPSPKLPQSSNGDNSGVFKDYLSFFPDVEGNIFYKVDYADGKNIYFVEESDISGFEDYVDDNEINIYMVSPSKISVNTNGDNSVIYLQNFAYGSAQHWVIAENITDIQFEYYVPGQGWKNEPTNDEIENQSIRKIRFTITGEKKVRGEVFSMESQGEVVLRNAF